MPERTTEHREIAQTVDIADLQSFAYIDPLYAPAAEPEISIPSLGTTAPIDYQVQDGDSVDALAGIFDVSPAAIRSLNNIPAGTEPRPGQSIRIPIR